MAMEQPASTELEAAVRRARSRAAATGELRPQSSQPGRAPLPSEVGDFVRRILTDGSYDRVVEEIGREDPDLATV